jgi:hypothetical protein
MPEVRHVTLTGTLRRASTNPATGYVRVGVLSMVQSPGSNEVIVEQGDPIELVDGAFSTLVPVANDPSLASVATIEVQVLLEDTRPAVLMFETDTAADTVDLADVVLLEVHTDEPVPVVPWSAVGKPDGVTPLGLDGLVPGEFLPAGVGGAYEHTQLVPAAVWGPIVHGLGAKPAAVSLFDATFATQYDEFAVQHLDANTLRIAMDVPTAGVALIS